MIKNDILCVDALNVLDVLIVQIEQTK